MEKREIGNKGEAFAAEFYKKAGYSITACNYSCRGGEIDIIAENDEYIIFIEVKTRSAKSTTHPHEAVDYNKIRRISVAADKFIRESETEKQPQFDVFELWHNEGRIYKFKRMENAFEPTSFGGRYDIF